MGGSGGPRVGFDMEGGGGSGGTDLPRGVEVAFLGRRDGIYDRYSACMTQVTVAAGATLEAASYPEPTVMRLATGKLTLTMTDGKGDVRRGSDPEKAKALEPGKEETLEPGDSVSLEDATYGFSNPSEDAADITVTVVSRDGGMIAICPPCQGWPPK